jgi:hypothetical protein
MLAKMIDSGFITTCSELPSHMHCMGINVRYGYTHTHTHALYLSL